MHRSRSSTRPGFVARFVCAAASLLCAGLLLSACGGGGGGHSARAAEAPVDEPPAAATVTGHVATGEPLRAAHLVVVDRNGHTLRLDADDNGAFSFSAGDFTAPLSILATDPLDIVESQIAVLVELPAAGATLTANVTPLSTAIAAGVSANGNPYEFAASTALATLHGDDVEKAQVFLRALLANLISDAELAADVDFIAAPIVPGSHAGLDLVLDDVQTNWIGTGLRIVNRRRAGVDDSGNPLAADVIVLNRDVVAGAPPAAFAATIVKADLYGQQLFLTGLREQLRACVAQAPTNRLDSEVCRGLVVPVFLDNGYGFDDIFDDFLDLSAATVVRTPTALYFPSKNEMLVELLTGDTIANRNRLVVTARRNSTANSQPGTWEITGDQSPYSAGLLGYLHRTTALGALGATVGYRSSIGVYYSAGAPNPAAVATVKVTGAGLPAAGLVLAPGIDNPGAFFIANKTGQLATSTDSAEQRFVLDATQSGALAALEPWPTGAAWADAPLSAALARTLAAHPAYEFTLYDASGNRIDSFTRRLDNGVEFAASGNDYGWSELDATTRAELTPPAAATALLTVGWVRPAFAAAVDRVVATASGDGATVIGAAGSGAATVLALEGRNADGQRADFPALTTAAGQRSISLYYRSPQRAEHVSEWSSGSGMTAIVVNPFQGQGSGSGVGSTLTHSDAVIDWSVESALAPQEVW